jgi:hypothetical protein
VAEVARHATAGLRARERGGELEGHRNGGLVDGQDDVPETSGV